MDHREKVRHLIRHADDLGLSEWSVAPPAWRLMWAMGWTIRPPHFLPAGRLFLVLAVGAGGPMGLFFGTIIGALAPGVLVGVGAAVAVTLIFGVPFGLIMTVLFRRQLRSVELPPWPHYPGGFARPVEPDVRA